MLMGQSWLTVNLAGESAVLIVCGAAVSCLVRQVLVCDVRQYVTHWHVVKSIQLLQQHLTLTLQLLLLEVFLHRSANISSNSNFSTKLPSIFYQFYSQSAHHEPRSAIGAIPFYTVCHQLAIQSIQVRTHLRTPWNYL